jgi:undecaprenyl-diphosphatase
MRQWCFCVRGNAAHPKRADRRFGDNFLVFIFGLIAQEVAGGETSAFDRRLILLLRDPANPSIPIGPAWLQEAARDVTSLGSIVVLVIVTLAVVGYLFLSRRRISAWLLLVAVFGGIALVDVPKAVFARPATGFEIHAARVFTASFPAAMRLCLQSLI